MNVASLPFTPAIHHDGKPAPLAKADALDGAVIARLRTEAHAGVSRRNERELAVAGTLRQLAFVSTSVRRLLAEAGTELVGRGGFERPLLHAALYGAHLLGDQGAAITVHALGSERAPWCAFVAATQSSLATVRGALARASTRANGHLRFGAAFVRALGGEPFGDRAAELSVMINEASRVRWVDDCVVPLLARGIHPDGSVVDALGALRRAERHMGRWLRLAEFERACGGEGVVRDCSTAGARASEPSRATWAWMHWVLAGGGTENTPSCLTREVIGKLSDRPSARRDLSFLHRLGESAVAAAAGPLASVSRGGTIDAVRALLVLTVRYGRTECIARLRTLATRGSEVVRGLAAAALWDVGDRQAALELVDQLVISKSIANVGWGALIRVAHLTGDAQAIVNEASVRRLCDARVY